MNGIILLDKPADMTSFTAAAILRRLLHVRKSGHTGTLDPFATGVLPVMLGGATRFIDFLPTHDKAYRAEIVTGVETDTLDLTGTVVARSDKRVTKEDVLRVLPGFTGKLLQTPPMYSAKLRNGVRLYALARQGVEVEREAVPVEIFSLELCDFDEENRSFTVDVRCSAGTYIRVLASDIGKALGCGAAVRSLRRTSANGFSLSECHTLDQLRAMAETDTAQDCVLPVDRALICYAAVTVTPPQATRFRNGGELDEQRLKLRGEGLFRVYDPTGAFLGMGEWRDGNLYPKKLLVD